MKSEGIKNALNKTLIRDCITVCCALLAAYAVVWMFTGMWPWVDNPYNSYVLQARSWLQGRLDLGRDYPYLELAVYQGKYFVSFPPMPSIVYLPFVLLFGNFKEGFISLAFAFLGGVYCVRLLHHFGIKEAKAVLWTILLMCASNLIFVCVNSWVWFIAQNMAFAFSIMAIYYACTKKGGWSLFFWACAVGCRPFQALYLPVLLYILYRGLAEDGESVTEMIKKRFYWCFGALIMAVIYMALNYARFGSIAEFGHNYLPEFVRSYHGQFSFSYLKENLYSLIRLPHVGEDHKLSFPMADGMNMFMVSPILIFWLVYSVRTIITKNSRDKVLTIGLLAIAAAEMLVIALHKTMGGVHFGNRYTNDILPLAFLGILVAKPNANRILYPVIMFGLALNIAGSIAFYIS